MKHFQLIVFRKLSGWKLEKSYSKKYTCHLGPEGQDVQQCRSFQSNQPIPNPSRDRSGQPVVRADTRTVQDGRKTSRSQENDVNSYHEETVSSDRSGQPVVETSKTQTRSSDDSKSLNVEMAHERTRRLVVGTNTENVPDGCKHVLVMKA